MIAAQSGQPQLAEIMAQFRRKKQDSRLPKTLEALIREVPERVTFDLTLNLLQSTAWRVVRRFVEVQGQLHRKDRLALAKEIGRFIDQMQGAKALTDYPAALHSRFQLVAAAPGPAAAAAGDDAPR